MLPAFSEDRKTQLRQWRKEEVDGQSDEEESSQFRRSNVKKEKGEWRGREVLSTS